MPLLSDLTFLFNITPVYIRPDVAENRMLKGYWFPPERREAFYIDQNNETGWCKWTAGRPIEQVGSLGGNATAAAEDVCSMFFDSECGHFLVVPSDCVRDGVPYETSWRRLAFEHLNDGHLSKVTFFAENLSLGGYGSRRWMPHLLPETYNTRERQVFTGLVGDLSLLVAMAAFTCEPVRGEFLSVMDQQFRPPWWIHPQPMQPSVKCLPRCHQQGLIVKIRPVPNSRIQQRELEAFQNGRHGALFNP